MKLVPLFALPFFACVACSPHVEDGGDQESRWNGPACKGDIGPPAPASPLSGSNYPRYPRAVLKVLAGTTVTGPATLLGVRTLQEPEQFECAAPFDATTSPCRASTVVQLAMPDGSTSELLVSLPAAAIEALGHDVSVRVSTKIVANPFHDELREVVVFATDGGAPLFGVHDESSFSNVPFETAEVAPLAFSFGPPTCRTTIDCCWHTFGGFSLFVAGGAAPIQVDLEGTADVSTTAGKYRIWHRAAADSVPNDSGFAECADLGARTFSFEFVRLP